MREQNQSGGASARMSQAARDSIDNSTNTVVIIEDHGSVDRLEAYKIAEELIDKKLPALTAEAQRQFTDRQDELTKNVIDAIAANQPELLSRLREARVQIALGNAQRGFAESGDADLRIILSELVIETIKEESRTHRDLILRQSIDIASKLTSKQLNALAVLMLLQNTHFPDTHGARGLLRSVTSAYSHYVGAIPSKAGEYSYIASVGCGTEAQLTAEFFGGSTPTPLQILYRAHRHLMYGSFYADELPEHLSIGEIGHIVRPRLLIQRISDDPQIPHFMYRVSDGVLPEALSGEGYDGAAMPANEANFARFINRRIPSEDEFIRLAEEEFPDIAALFDSIVATRAQYLQINAVGRVLGCQTAITHSPEKRDVFESILLDESEQP